MTGTLEGMEKDLSVLFEVEEARVSPIYRGNKTEVDIIFAYAFLSPPPFHLSNFKNNNTE